MVATTGAALGAAGTLASHASVRAKEADLLFVGQQYRQAIQSFYERSPGAKRYPQSVQELLEDKRFPKPARHLRKPYADPVTGKDIALLDAPGGGFMGVFSPSEAAPLKSGNFARQDEAFAEGSRYQDWKFFYQPRQPGDAEAQPDGPNGLSAQQPRNTPQ